jgi:hypothetical protein
MPFVATLVTMVVCRCHYLKASPEAVREDLPGTCLAISSPTSGFCRVQVSEAHDLNLTFMYELGFFM